MNLLSQFREAIQALGLTPPVEIIADGKLHRFASNGNPGDDSGRYVIHLDSIPAAGWIGDWRNDIKQKWRANMDRTLTPAEKVAYRTKIKAIQAEREADEKARRAEAAAKANALWKAAMPVAADHPYLLRKQIAPVATLREINVDTATAILGYLPKSRGEQLIERLLVVPIKVGDAISTCELIDGDGRKSAIYGGAKAAGYWAAQPLPNGDGNGVTLLIGEGVATILSAHKATGKPVIATLSSGNLLAVAKAMRTRYPSAQLVILGDLGNGMEKAEHAARAVGALLVVPEFAGDHVNGATDLNDLAVLHGLDAVKKAIEAAKALKPASAQSERERSLEGEYISHVELICGSDLVPEPVTWLWNGWLAAGKMHILGGAPGTGKTTIAMALAATVTVGGRWPDGLRSPVGNVVVWSGEDDPRDTLMPRLALSGADMSRVYFIADVREGNDRRSFDPARDMDMLRRELAKIGDVRLLIIDPIVSAVTGDSHKNAEVRRGLQPLADLAAALRCALLGITHLSKGTGGRDPVERLTGSLAFGAVARVVMMAAKHQEGDEGGRVVRLFLRAKSNIGPDDGGFEYDLHQDELKAHPGVFASAVLWGNAVQGTARELLATADAAGDEGEGGSLGDAKRFLSDLLADGPLSTKVIDADVKGAGYSTATVRRAKKALGIKAAKTSMKGGWEWALPPEHAKLSEGAQQKTKDAQQKGRSIFGNDEHLRTDSDEVEVEI